MRTDFDANWSDLQQHLNSFMREWRVAHPKATLNEIELALDTQMAQVRAKMLESLACASAATNPKGESATEQPLCPNCGGGLHSRGQQKRHLITQRDHSLELERTYSYCPKCEAGFFPPR